MCLLFTRNVPSGVDLVVFGSPSPSCPVETTVANTAFLPSKSTSVCASIDTSIHFWPRCAACGHSFGAVATATSRSLTHVPAFVSK